MTAKRSMPPMKLNARINNLFLTDLRAQKLEAALWSPTEAAPAFAALVCHPHPLFGGTMHNKVVFQAAKAMDALGVAVLRFNFRGAGSSEGRYDRGQGKRDDVRAALDFLTEEFQERRSCWRALALDAGWDCGLAAKMFSGKADRNQRAGEQFRLFLFADMRKTETFCARRER
jgi:hypothetical protein